MHALAAVLEPSMTIRRVRVHLVDDNLQSAIMCSTEQAIKGIQVAKNRIDTAMIRHVITEVILRRFKERTNPQPVHTEVANIVQLRRNARQVADTVTIAVAEAARINLVNDGSAPPGCEWQTHQLEKPTNIVSIYTAHSNRATLAPILCIGSLLKAPGRYGMMNSHFKNGACYFLPN